MHEHKPNSDAICEEQVLLAERELSSFISAVTELYGPEQARVSEKEWLDESELMDAPFLSTGRNWRAVTIAASARLANRVSAERKSANSREPNHTKVSPIPSSDCSDYTLLF